MYFSSKIENCDDNPLYHTYNNLIGYTYDLMDFTNKNDNTLEAFYKFLWDKQQHFLLFNQATLFSILPIDNKKNLYNTNIIICKNNHIYIIKYLYKQHISFNSNETSPLIYTIREVLDEIRNADYFLIDITETLYNQIVPQINRLHNKNDFYKSQCQILGHYLNRWMNNTINRNDIVHLYK
jgi:hypothetical protein